MPWTQDQSCPHGVFQASRDSLPSENCQRGGEVAQQLIALPALPRVQFPALTLAVHSICIPSSRGPMPLLASMDTSLVPISTHIHTIKNIIIHTAF